VTCCRDLGEPDGQGEDDTVGYGSGTCSPGATVLGRGLGLGLVSAVAPATSAEPGVEVASGLDVALPVGVGVTLGVVEGVVVGVGLVLGLGLWLGVDEGVDAGDVLGDEEGLLFLLPGDGLQLADEPTLPEPGIHDPPGRMPPGSSVALPLTRGRPPLPAELDVWKNGSWSAPVWEIACGSSRAANTPAATTKIAVPIAAAGRSQPSCRARPLPVPVPAGRNRSATGRSA